MKLKTSELIGKALDWAAAECLFKINGTADVKPWAYANHLKGATTHPFSTDWIWGGTVIEKERITVDSQGKDYCRWRATSWDHGWFYGDTPLVAAMRCFVYRHLGDEVEIPDGL